jgi:NAD(P)-dependent dehydrogenase (short-subunit alcohol dehydrogenase family)
LALHIIEKDSTMNTTSIQDLTPIAIITGGSRGLGKSTAMHIAKSGSDVILTYHSQQADAEAVVKAIVAMGRRAIALRLDVADSASFSTFAAKIKQTLQQYWQREHFNFLVNNAGSGVHVSFMETSEAQFDEMVNQHLKGVFFLTQKLVPLMQDGGRIINISSGLTRFTLPNYSAYASMKGAVETLSKYIAKELGPRGIAVNTVAPGAIETDFGGGAVRDKAQLNSFIASQTALGRAGLPDDIGGLIATLLSHGSGWVNGQRIEASGGMLL